ncbi:MAG: 4a-hydroxytetrahydrobiopterin dehydratase [Thermoleophilaceae bacterium]
MNAAFFPWMRRPSLPPSWNLAGDTLFRDLAFRSFEDGMEFIDRLAAEAVDYGRHPEMRISAGQVRVSIRNPNRAGLTEAELRLAQKVDAVIDDQRPSQ